MLEETFFKKQCPVCGKEINFIHPLLYVDRIHHFILLIKSKKDWNESDHTVYESEGAFRKRYISNGTAVGEKLKILEDDLDDCSIELIKLKLFKKYQLRYPDLKEIKYHDRDKSSETIWFDLMKQEHDIIAIEEAVYQNVLKNIPKDGNDFVEIDISWAMKQLEH